MAMPKKPFSLLDLTWSFLEAVYNNPFWWSLFKSYGIFLLAIPLANSFGGYEILN